jgi:hypothetical protein
MLRGHEKGASIAPRLSPLTGRGGNFLILEQEYGLVINPAPLYETIDDDGIFFATARRGTRSSLKGIVITILFYPRLSAHRRTTFATRYP